MEKYQLQTKLYHVEDVLVSFGPIGEAEVRELRTFGKGEALLLMGEQRFAVRFEASESEYQIATSDPADLAKDTHQEKGEAIV